MCFKTKYKQDSLLPKKKKRYINFQIIYKHLMNKEMNEREKFLIVCLKSWEATFGPLVVWGWVNLNRWPSTMAYKSLQLRNIKRQKHLKEKKIFIYSRRRKRNSIKDKNGWLNSNWAFLYIMLSGSRRNFTCLMGEACDSNVSFTH